jgi:hypothetical protein
VREKRQKYDSLSSAYSVNWLKSGHAANPGQEVQILKENSSHLLNFANVLPKPKSTEGMIMQTVHHFYTVHLITLVTDIMVLQFSYLQQDF